MIRILTEPKNAILKQTKYLFGLDDIEIEFTKDAKRAIAKKAKALGTNARGLKNVVDTVVLPYQFDAEEMVIEGEKVEAIIDETSSGNPLGAGAKKDERQDLCSSINDHLKNNIEVSLPSYNLPIHVKGGYF